MRNGKSTNRDRSQIRTISVLGIGAAAVFGGGCTAIGFFGAMAKTAHENSSTVYPAQYGGLEGKSFAVVVAADRSIQSDNPDIVPLMTGEVTKRLVEHCGASGVVPPGEVLRFQYQRPGWIAMTPTDLAKELDVQRLVYIELTEFATTDSGNPYLWNGVAVANVQVLEADGPLGDTYAFREVKRVKYPDQEGLGSIQIPAETVRLELSRRIINRVSWLFYENEEPNNLKY